VVVILIEAFLTLVYVIDRLERLQGEVLLELRLLLVSALVPLVEVLLVRKVVV